MCFVATNDAVFDYWKASRTGNPSTDMSARPPGNIVLDYAVANRWATACTADSSTNTAVPVGNCKAIKNRLWIFAIVEVETPMVLFVCAVAVDNCSGDHAWVVWVGAADGYGEAEKVDVSVSCACVSAGIYNYYVEMVGNVDSGLDCVKIGGGVVGTRRLLRRLSVSIENGRIQGKDPAIRLFHHIPPGSRQGPTLRSR